VFRFFIYDDWERRRLNTVQNGVQSAQLKHGNMEDWVYSMHSSWKTECPGQRSYLIDDIKRSQIFFGELL
jgi:hypothetical protein